MDSVLDDPNEGLDLDRCMGQRRYGGAFTLGPVRWERCKNPAVFIVDTEDDKGPFRTTICLECWKEAEAEKLPIRNPRMIKKEG